MKKFIIGYGCVFTGHVLGQFLLVGHVQALPSFLGNELGAFLFPFLAAFAGYLWVFDKSPIFRSRLRWRFAKFLGLSLISVFVSLWIGLVLVVNTYGS